MDQKSNYQGLLMHEHEQVKKDAEATVLINGIIDILPHYIFWKNKDSVFLGCNEIFAKSAGLSSPNEIIGKTDYDLPWTKAESDKYRADDREVMSTGLSKLNIEETQTFPDGREIILLTSKVPLTNRNNEIIGVACIYTDITARKEKEAELLKTKTELARFKAMSALGGMIAHELRTPLATIEGTMYNIEKVLPTLIDGYELGVKAGEVKEPLRKDLLNALKQTLDDIKYSIHYAQTTIKTILTSFHPDFISAPSKKESFSILETVRQAIKDYPFQKHEKELVLVEHLDDVMISGEKTIITHVLHNLLKNALHVIAAEEKGEITIWTECKDNYLHLYFEDTAKGIATKQLEHIFDAFYTTKEKTAASIGLGLYFCKMALEKMGGKIICQSKLGQYTRFKLTLPLHKQDEQ